MRRILPLVALALAPLLAPTPTHAQPSPQPSPEAEVRAVVDRMFDGMRQGDSAMVRSVFHPQARLMTTAVRDGATVMREDSIDRFVRMVGTPHDEVWDERISNVKVEVDGPLAMAWMDYAFYAGERFSHCGVNAFLFFRAAEGWKVVQIMDTRRREGCPGQAAPAA